MAKFKVGDRARIVRVEDAYEALGKSCTIIAWHSAGECWEVNVDGIGEWNGDLWYGFDESALEPILYDGAQPSEFSYSELMENLRTKVQEEV